MKSLIRFSRRGSVIKALAALTILMVAAVLLIPQVRWRLHLLFLSAVGTVPDIEFQQVFAYMLPGSEQSIEPMIRTRNPFEVVRNTNTSPEDIRAGGALFQKNGCARCHGADASGGPGCPPLNAGQLKSGASDWAMYLTIRRGVANTAMPAHKLPDVEMWQLISFLRYLDHSDEVVVDAVNTVKLQVNTPYEEIAATRMPSKEWLTYSGSYTSWRHSSLSEITAGNVGQLALKWIRPFSRLPGGIEATPLVRNGIMFLTVLPSRVIALDASTGHQIWTYEHTITAEAASGDYQPANRGVALLDDKVFFGTRDAKLFALSAETGGLLWERSLSTNPDRYFVSSAPLAIRDLVVIGVGTRQGGRGFLVAFDANTGAERWRFTSIPAPGEAGNETWSGESWREGGGPMWMTGSYDVEQDLLIWGVGNPKPDYDKTVRKGDNLYTNSVVAIRGSTGELVWHFQFTPGDDHDWDSAQVPILVDDKNGRKFILWANRNGFYYVLDRSTGKFVTGVPFVKQTWSEGLDANGRPRLATDSLRKRFGSIVSPGNVGGTNWWPPTYDPELNLVFVPSLEQGMVYFASKSSWPTVRGGQTFYTAIRALDPLTGARRWEYRHAPRLKDNKTGGLISTRAGLLFGGDQTTFFALDSRTGTKLWSVETGGLIMAAPMTYSVNGQQFVTVAAGENLLTFGLPTSQAATKAPVRP